jgi:RNA polymerase sigma factor (sigma-70 family)
MMVAINQSDSSLLHEFAVHRSQDAFSELVSRHSDWVYSASVRLVRDRELAEDVAQAVFLVLADKAGKLRDVPLHRWLFKVTRYAAANAIRARTRREKYERLAAMSTSETYEADLDRTWEEIAPILDDSISHLRSRDRDALLMRFYQQKNLAEVAAGLGVSEGAAKIRITRAIEKLRSLLRRRGIAVPTDTLGAALLAQTTHSAPIAFVSRCISTSASIKATSISQGVSKMLMTTKLKIAAAVILLGGIPVGTGAYLLASSADRSAVAPSNVTVPAAPVASPSLDPRVAPFVTDRTDMIMVIDLTKIDLDAVAADMRGELGRSQMDAPSAARINGMITMGVGVGKLWINGFKQVGGKTIFALSRADELTITKAVGSGSPTLKLTATFVFPTDSSAQAAILAKYLTSPGGKSLKVIGDTVVNETSAPDTQEQGDWAENRSALPMGLASAADAPIRASMNPAKLKEILPKLMASGQITPGFTGHEWDNLEYASLNLVLPPAESPGLLILSHHKDAASAEKAKNDAEQRIASVLKSSSGKNTPVGEAMMKFMATEKFTTKGSDLIATMDLHPYWDLIFAAVRSSQPGGAQGQAK